MDKVKEQPPAGELRKLEDEWHIFEKECDVRWDDDKKCQELRGAWAYDIFTGGYEAGHKEACEIIDRSEAGERILEERIEKLSDTLDRSEASQKELLTACEKALDESHNPKVEKVLADAINKAK